MCVHVHKHKGETELGGNLDLQRDIMHAIAFLLKLRENASLLCAYLMREAKFSLKNKEENTNKMSLHF